MNAQEFRRILTSFVDTPSDLGVEKGEFVVQVRGEVIHARIAQRQGELVVCEEDDEVPAVPWLVNRVARLQQLPDRILTYIPEERHFVEPSGTLLDSLDAAADDEPRNAPHVVECLQHLLGRRPGLATSLVYLTSDAGEGKTTVVHHLARTQARAFKEKRTDWLLLPITLGGRTLLRLDDVIVGSLVSRLRFQLWYYEGLVELIRLGVIIPALDGFEEMFVERSTGEAVSALGNLVRMLESSGTLLISARKAYFEYASLQTQARLFDSLGDASVAFARVGLERWGRPHFCGYCAKRGLADGDDLHEDVCAKLGADHPLLTRAVLVHRLVSVAAGLDDRKALLERLGARQQRFFTEFISAIVDREITEKWIDRSGEPARPLLTQSEHYELLSSIAQEMWTTSSNALPDETLGTLTDIFCEEKGKSVPVSRQVKERIRQHAPIVRMEPDRPLYSFDHEELRDFFLGWGIGHLAAQRARGVMRLLLEPGPLTDQSMDAIAQVVQAESADVRQVVDFMQFAPEGHGPDSFARENAGGSIIRLLDSLRNERTELSSLCFPPDALRGRRIEGVTFSACRFQPTELSGTHLRRYSFEDCEIDRLDLGPDMVVEAVSLAHTRVRSLVVAGGGAHVFDPEQVVFLLRQQGFMPREPEPSTGIAPPLSPDEDLAAAERVFKAFLRATALNEDVLKLKLGTKTKTITEALLDAGVLREVQYLGHGKQRRFRLAAQMRDIERAESGSGGSFTQFLANIRQG